MLAVQLHQIDTVIQQDITASQALLALLKAEQQALKSRKHRDLESLVRQKNTHISTLDSNARKRHHLMKQAGINDNEQSWENFLSLFDNQKLLEDWDTVKTTVGDCQYWNEVNGKMIVRSQRAVRGLLDILCGRTEEAGLYTQAGEKRSSRGGNSDSFTMIKA